MGDDKNKNWFEWYCQQVEAGTFQGEEKDHVFTCPCCGYPTLSNRGGYDICPLCGWEDDGQDSHNAAMVLGGPNGDYSLAEARENFERHQTQYRPEDSRFERETARREWVRRVRPELESFRWKGRLGVTEAMRRSTHFPGDGPLVSEGGSGVYAMLGSVWDAVKRIIR